MRGGGNPRPSKGDDVRLIWSVGIIYVRHGVYRCVCGGETDREEEREEERANKWKKECQLAFLHTHRHTHSEAHTMKQLAGMLWVGEGGAQGRRGWWNVLKNRVVAK